MKLVGIILIVFGIVALIIGGIRYTKREKVIDLGPIEATTEKHETIPLPPVVGIVSVAAGVVLLLLPARPAARPNKVGVRLGAGYLSVEGSF